jgi:hypothetical protein
MRALTLVPLLFAIACGNSSNNTNNADAASGSDAPTGGSDVPSGSTIKISGVATIQTTSTPGLGANVVVGAYASSDENTPVATATTDAQGNYTLTLPTSGPLDGFLKATKAADGSTTYVDTYLYPPVPITTDFANAAINMVSTSNYGLLNALFGGDAAAGMIVLEVVDSTTLIAPVSGATVTITPALPDGKTALYTKEGSSLPNSSATATGADGRAFLLKAPTGTVTVTASATQGPTFKPTTLNVHAGAFTTTLITE